MKKISAFWPLLVSLLTVAISANSATAKPTQKVLDSALFWAIANNDLGRVQSLLARGANVNARDAEGRTALIIASFVGDPRDELMRFHPLALVQLLLKRGADVNLCADDGETALMNAAESDVTATRLLLDKGARLNAQDASGETALMRAVVWECEGPCSNPSSVRLLLQRGADPNLADENAATALMRAAQLSSYGALTAKDGLLMAKMLLAHGADVRARTRNGNTALKWAEVGGNPATIRLFEQAEARR